MNLASDAENRPKVLAISSGGGHWVQLLRLRPAFEGCDVMYATVKEGYRADLGEGADFRVIRMQTAGASSTSSAPPSASRGCLLRLKPDVVITTGAAPGYFAVRFGKLLGARVVWVDSVANAEELSLSGQKAGSFVDLWLTQWPHLARDGGPQCFGSVL